MQRFDADTAVPNGGLVGPDGDQLDSDGSTLEPQGPKLGRRSEHVTRGLLEGEMRAFAAGVKDTFVEYDERVHWRHVKVAAATGAAVGLASGFVAAIIAILVLL